MSERQSAQIIPFPSRHLIRRETPPAPVSLTVSLASLSAALEEQRASVEAWRSAVHDLSNCMKTLGVSLDRFTAKPPGQN